MSDTFIGHCRPCKLTRRFEAPVLSKRALQAGSLAWARTVYDRVRDASSAAPFGARGPTVTEYHDRPGVLWLLCPGGHHVRFHKVRGTVSNERCGAKCTGARGPSCECSCGGQNHGARHA